MGIGFGWDGWASHQSIEYSKTSTMNDHNVLGASTMNVEVSDYSTQLQKAANDLWKAKRKSLVVAGGNDKNIHLIVNAINDLLGNFGSTIDFTKRSYLKQGNDADAATLLNDMKAGKVGTLIAYNVNPVYNLAD